MGFTAFWRKEKSEDAMNIAELIDKANKIIRNIRAYRNPYLDVNVMDNEDERVMLNFTGEIMGDINRIRKAMDIIKKITCRGVNTKIVHFYGGLDFPDRHHLLLDNEKAFSTHTTVTPRDSLRFLEGLLKQRERQLGIVEKNKRRES